MGSLEQLGPGQCGQHVSTESKSTAWNRPICWLVKTISPCHRMDHHPKTLAPFHKRHERICQLLDI